MPPIEQYMPQQLQIYSAQTATVGPTTILRGFKVSVAVLDTFLAVAANHVDETYGKPPFYQKYRDNDPISVLLYTEVTAAGGIASKNRFRVIIPSREGNNESSLATQQYALQLSR